MMQVFTTEQSTRSVVRVADTTSKNVILDIAQLGTAPWTKEIAAILTPYQACYVACALIGHALSGEKVSAITSQIFAEAARAAGAPAEVQAR